MDLTSLMGDETETDIINLCQRGSTPFGNVAALCIYPKYLKLAKVHCPAGVRLATVVNFSSGALSQEDVVIEAKSAISAGADELDLVIPYHEVLSGDFNTSATLVEMIKEVCGQRCLKVILETGALIDPRLIFRISEVLLDHGADFLKTSTGKISVGATESAVDAMLKALWQYTQKNGIVKGLKVSGGIKTLKDANLYADMARAYFDASYLTAKTFRIGASSLLQELLSGD